MIGPTSVSPAPGNMLEALYNVGPFPEKLSLIGDILPVAPSANPEMRTNRRPVVGRLGKRLDYPCLGVISLLPRYEGFHSLPGNGPVHENHKPVHFGYGFAPKRELINLKLDLRSFDYLFHYSPDGNESLLCTIMGMS